MAVNVIKDTPPSTADGRQIFLSSAVGDSLEVQYTGCGDDITNGVRLAGADFVMDVTEAGDTTIEFQFLDWVDILGGVCHYLGANHGDYMHYEVYAPATPATENTGAGGYIKYPIGDGMNIFIPHPTAEGDWDLDLEETLNANVAFTKVVPIPDANKEGFFNWDADTETVTVAPGMNGTHNLFDFAMPLGRMINKCWVLGDGTENYLVPASYSAKRLLPHWIHKVTTHRVGTGTLEIVWMLFLARTTTQPES